MRRRIIAILGLLLLVAALAWVARPLLRAVRQRPHGLTRRAFRTPLYLYRHRLGWLFGHRVLCLTHRGRRSGIVRQTVLEVVRYDPASREAIVVSAWGEHADWYRNIQASPALLVQIGREQYPPAQRFLTASEVDAELRDYQRRHPFLARLIPRLFNASSLEAFGPSLRMVAFTPEPVHGESG